MAKKVVNQSGGARAKLTTPEVRKMRAVQQEEARARILKNIEERKKKRPEPPGPK
jgi:hypothetical protein